ncbi:MAG: Asp-tRNA(Asn)/Glu-tRNA(Gln) amidotransferase subunit GatB [Candidatus Paceibacterota bacterium]
MKDYKTTIGLEIHAELKTKTKMFCNSKNDPDEDKPNVNICPVCMGHPGTLPVVNKEAVRHVLRVGVAVGGKIADFTEFDRKNYFYPDIPKGYQISQYKYPLVSGGMLRGIEITRVHLEEDTGTSLHEEGDYSLLNYNRAGVPLMELVTEPVIHTAKDASDFARELQLLLRYLGAGEANMEKGEMRVEANISVSADEKLGTKVEVKNLNSFKTVEKAIEYEVKRHIEALENGEQIVQETRGWDEVKQATFSQRKKEDSHDYRYFPDPDIPKFKLSEFPEFRVEEIKKGLPELPWEKRKRYEEKYGIKLEDVEIYVRDKKWADYFEKVTAEFKGDVELIKLASNYITSDLVGLIKSIGEAKFPEAMLLAKLIKMTKDSMVSSRGAKDILKIMYGHGGDPEEIANKEGLLQKSNEEELKATAEKIIAANSQVAADYKAGKESSLQFLIGQGMKETKGSANPQVLRKIFMELLKN